MNAVIDEADRHAAPPGLAAAAATGRSIASAAGATVVSRVAAKLALLALLLVAARTFGASEFATYGYLVSLVTIGSTLGDAGVAQAASREVAGARMDATDAFWSAAPVVAVAALLATAAVLAVARLDAGPTVPAAAAALAAAATGVNMVGNFVSTFVRGLGRMRFEAWVQLGSVAVFVAVGIAILAGGGGPVALLVAVLAREVAVLLVTALALRGPTLAPRRPTRASLRHLFGIGVRLALASSALALATGAPLLALGATGSADEVGYYAIAMRLGDTAVVAAMTVGFALAPILAHLDHDDTARAFRLARRVGVGAAAAGTGVAVLALGLAGPLVPAVMGAEYEPAVSATRIIALALPATTVLGLAWYALMALGHERTLLRLVVVGAAVSVAAAAAASPAWGEDGAAMAYAAGLTATGLLAGLALARTTRRAT